MLKERSWNIKIVDECDSTNSQVKLLKANSSLYDRTALMTYFQLNGRGQGGNSWHSSHGTNLLVSFYRKIEIPVSKNFMLTIIASLALYRLLKKYGVNCKIKWPNDIYFRNNKIAGILIENSLMRNLIIDSTIGIGLNINETNFPEWIPNACSILQVIGKSSKPESVCKELTRQLDSLFDEYNKDMGVELYHSYINLLYRLNHWHLFRKDGHTFNGRINGVEPDGRLILETEDGSLTHLLFGEIEYVI